MCVNVKSCSELLEDYVKSKNIIKPERLIFRKMDAYDVYNVSVPFNDGDDTYIAGRIDKRGSEISKVVIFEKKGDAYEPTYPEVVFDSFQDPFVVKIQGEIVLGGVQIDTDPLDSQKIICWRTLFFKGKNIHSLKLFASGPNRMKDIRVTELDNGKIGLFTRPQGGKAGNGKIGFISLNSLDEINEENILKAKIYDTFFKDNEWGGVNDIQRLKNGMLGVVGHIAHMSGESERHYFSCAFAFNTETLEHTPIKIIATRSDLLDGPAKRDDLRDVLFSGGLIRKGEFATLYTGVSDAQAQYVDIKDPFLEYEENCRA